MTCEHLQPELALYTAGDLAALEAATLAQHLAGCDGCRSFLRELQASQGALLALSQEPLPAEALAAVRQRVLASTAQARPSRRVGTAGRWAAAAALLLAAALGVFWLRLPSPRPGVALDSRPAPAGGGVAEASPATPSLARVADGTGRPRTAPAPGRRVEALPASTAARLTAEEADQLAYALVVVSGIESVSETPVEGAAAVRAEVPGSLIRWATRDPDVVIYWLIDANGGES